MANRGFARVCVCVWEGSYEERFPAGATGGMEQG